MTPKVEVVRTSEPPPEAMMRPSPVVARPAQKVLLRGVTMPVVGL